MYFTNDEERPAGLTNVIQISSLRVETTDTGDLPDPIEAWSFNGDSGLTGSQDGTLLSLATGTKIFGPGPLTNQQSFFCNGSSRLSTAVTASLELTGAMSLSAFVYPVTDAAAVQFPVAYAANNETSDGNSLYSLRITAGNLYTIFLETGSGSDILPQPTPDFAVQAGQWNHLVYVRDENNTNFMYHNGVLVHSGTEGGPTGGSNSFMNIGAFPSDGSNFTGYVFSVKVFGVPLTANQVRLESNSVLGGRIQ